MTIKKLLGSSALRTAVGFALGGGGFAIANLLLAKWMAPGEYGLVVLLIAVTQLATTLGPAGMDTVAVRHKLAPSAALLMRVVVSGTILGGVAAVVIAAIFHTRTELGYMLILAAIAASLNRVACAFMQSLGRFQRSMFMLIGHNAALLLAAALLMLSGRRDVEFVAIIVTAGYAASAIYGWVTALRRLAPPAEMPPASVLRREGFTMLAAQMSTALLNQLDRFMIPRVLSPAALGEYAATMTTCASPFNLLQSGARHSLLPKVRHATSRSAALAHIKSEAAVTLAIAAIAAAGCLLVAPPVARWLFEGQYEFDMDLVQLVVGLGVLKLWHGFSASCIQALGTRRSLFLSSCSSWLALTVAIICVLGIPEPELTSVVSAIGAGWLTLCIASTFIAYQAYHESPEIWEKSSHNDESIEDSPEDGPQMRVRETEDLEEGVDVVEQPVAAHTPMRSSRGATRS